MAPTRSQKAAKAADAGDETSFVKKQSSLYRKKVKSRQDSARAQIRKNRIRRIKDLQERIQALKRKAPTERRGKDENVSSSDQTLSGNLRDLLARKASIERSIAERIEILEKAMKTTSSELQTVLATRVKTLASTDPASLLVVKH